MSKRPSHRFGPERSSCPTSAHSPPTEHSIPISMGHPRQPWQSAAHSEIERMAPADCAAHYSILGSRSKPVKDELAHVFYDRFAEFAALYFVRPRHHPREIVGHGLRVDRAFHALDDEIRGLVPLHIPQ